MSHELAQWISEEMEALVDQRRQLLDQRRVSIQNAEHLEALARKVPLASQPEKIGPLTAEKLPPQELHQVLSRLEQELENIRATRVEIECCDVELAQIHHRRKVLAVVVGCLAVIAVIWLVLLFQ